MDALSTLMQTVVVYVRLIDYLALYADRVTATGCPVREPPPATGVARPRTWPGLLGRAGEP